MDKKIVRQVITETLEAVSDQVNLITAYEGKIPWIEVDITKDYLRTLYENILVLERYNGIEEEIPVAEREKQQPTKRDARRDEFIPPLPKAAVTVDEDIHPELPKNVLKEELQQPVSTPKKEVKTSDSVNPTPAPKPQESIEVEFLEPIEPTPVEKSPMPQEKPVLEETPVIEAPVVKEQEPEPEETPVMEVPVVKEQEPAETKPEIPPVAPKSEAPKPVVEQPIEEPPVVPVKESVIADVVVPKKVVTESPIPGKESTSLGDKLKSEKKSFGETMAAGEQTLADQIKKKPIRSLKSVIGINDKFYFVNDLFKGVLKDYNECINALDMAPTFDAAKRILDSKLKKHDWSHDSDAFIKLQDFINRRY